MGGEGSKPLSTHQHRALPHIHLLLCCSGRLNTSVQLDLVIVMRHPTLMYRFSAECNSTLGLGDGSLPDHALNASGAWAGYEAAKARLNSDGGWGADYKAGLWLQVALNSVTNITALATQGHSIRNSWTNLYRLSSSLDGNDWQPYGKVGGIFRGSVTIILRLSHSPKPMCAPPTACETNIRETGNQVLWPWSRVVRLTFLTTLSAVIIDVRDIFNAINK